MYSLYLPPHTITDHTYDDPEDAALFRFREEDIASFGDNVQLHDALLPYEQLQMTDVLGEGTMFFITVEVLTISSVMVQAHLVVYTKAIL